MTREKPLRMKAHENPLNVESFEVSGSASTGQSERQYLCGTGCVPASQGILRGR